MNKPTSGDLIKLKMAHVIGAKSENWSEWGVSLWTKIITIQEFLFHFFFKTGKRSLFLQVRTQRDSVVGCCCRINKMEVGGRRFKSTETMAVQSVTRSAPPPRSKATTAFLQNPKTPFAVALLFADAILVFLIIAFVPCNFTFIQFIFISIMHMLIWFNFFKFSDTKIDWDAYMSQVQGFLQGERDYRDLKGDTGPLVYPSGFLYIYSAFQYLTGGLVFPAQVIQNSCFNHWWKCGTGSSAWCFVLFSLCRFCLECCISLIWQ